MSRELHWLTLTVGADRADLGALHPRSHHGARPDGRDEPIRHQERQAAITWAVRMMFAHANAVENLVIFAPFVLPRDALNIRNASTAFACALFFWCRLAHVASLYRRLPVARTLAFTGGFIAQVSCCWRIFGVMYS